MSRAPSRSSRRQGARHAVPAAASAARRPTSRRSNLVTHGVSTPSRATGCTTVNFTKETRPGQPRPGFSSFSARATTDIVVTPDGKRAFVTAVWAREDAIAQGTLRPRRPLLVRWPLQRRRGGDGGHGTVGHRRNVRRHGGEPAGRRPDRLRCRGHDRETATSPRPRSAGVRRPSWLVDAAGTPGPRPFRARAPWWWTRAASGSTW